MMLRTAMLSAAALVCCLCFQAGCREKKGTESMQLPVTTENVVNDLTFPDPARQIQAAESLKKLSTEDQKKVISTLEDMLKKETNPTVQAEIRSGLSKAKQAIGG